MIDHTIVDEAIALIGIDRNNDYGDFDHNMREIAAGWSTIIGANVTSADAARMMAWLKIVRSSRKYKRDNYVDAVAYLLMAEALDTKKLVFDTERHTS